MDLNLKKNWILYLVCFLIVIVVPGGIAISGLLAKNKLKKTAETAESTPDADEANDYNSEAAPEAKKEEETNI